MEDNKSQTSQRQQTLIKFLKDTQDGKYSEIKKERVTPSHVRTTILRQPPPPDRIYFFSIS